MSDGPEDATRPPPPPSGRRLRVVGSDTYADWDEVYGDNVVWIYRLLFGKVGNRPDAEDLTTEVFMAALGPLRISASRLEVRAYLAAAARTALAGYWRRRLGVQVTSIDPELAVRERDWRSRKRRLDAAAAAIILQDYLDTRPSRLVPMADEPEF